MNAQSLPHKWRFFRYGGLDQVSLESAQDLRNLEKLDPKLWAAMTCPVDNIHFDAKTLEYLDSDSDRRIKIPEILQAIKWLDKVLRDIGVILKPATAMPIDVINTEDDEGAALFASAKRVLSNLGKPDVKSISIEDLADTRKIFSVTQFNGDGIITADVPADEDAIRLIREVMDCVGSLEDRSEKPGINEDLLQKFLQEAESFLNWKKKSKENSGEIFFVGKETEAAAALYSQLKPKIDDYFTRCRLAEFDSRYSQAAAVLENDYATLLHKSISGNAEELRQLPLSLSSAQKDLVMNKGINPAWAQQMVDFSARVAGPIIGSNEVLTESNWLKIRLKFAPYEAWQAEKAGSLVEKLGEERVSAILGGKAVATVKEMLEKDKALAPEFEALTKVDKLVRYYLHLFKLLNNFVSFRDFYDTEKRSVFQSGILYMDSRSCSLCVRVDDVAKHSAMAAGCNIYLVYCDCVRRGSNEKMTIAAGFTDGDSEQLQVGRNGLFVDRSKNYWDATIVKVIDHPISIRQAFWKPYQRIAALIQEQIEKFASSKEKEVGDSLSKTVSEQAGSVTTASSTTKAQAAATPFDVGKFAGIFAAIGLALAAIGSTVASVVAGFMSLKLWQMPLAVMGVMLLISGPSMIMTAMRLRRRNLGSILDANGWAVNTRAQINISFGRTLTHIAVLPQGSIKSFDDPFADKKRPWLLYLLVFLALAVMIWLYAAPADNPTRMAIMSRFSCNSEAVKNVPPASSPISLPEKAVASPTVSP